MSRRTLQRSLAAFLCVLGVASIGLQFSTSSSGAQLGRRALQLSSAEVSASARYRLAFTYSSTGTVGSVRVQFCANNPIIDDPCTPPSGFDASQAALSNQSGATGFSVATGSPPNEIVIRRIATTVAPTNAVYEFTGVQNPDAPGSYYARVQTYASTDGTGPASDYGGIAFAINNSVSITATVPPYLIFCTGTAIPNLNCGNASGDFVNFGELSASRASSGTSKMLVATNAANGYSISYQGGTLTSGNNELKSLASNDVSRPGTSQFGFNLRANSTPGRGENPVGPGVNMPQNNYNQPNLFRFVSGESLVTNPGPEDVRQYTATYVANIPNNQAAGIYVSTITYICLANF